MKEIYDGLVAAFPDIILTLFGSTYNGFGLHMSDVDICLRFKEYPIDKVYNRDPTHHSSNHFCLHIN